MIIGIHGAKRAGKDTVGDLFDAFFEWTTHGTIIVQRESFAKPIKDVVKTVFGWDADWLENRKEDVDPRYGVSPRVAMQTLGTEWGRNCLGEDIWVRLLKQRVIEFRNLHFSNPVLTIITDVRFKNETEFIRNESPDNLLFKVTRRGLVTNDSHQSENDLNEWTDWDAEFHNDGTLDDLKEITRDYAARFISPKLKTQ